VFYFQQLLNIALSGIDKTGIIPAVTNVAYGVLLIGFLIGLYQAVMRGGDVQALGVTAIKYLVVAIIIANWATLFRDVNNSFNSVAQFIGNASGAGDMFLSWMDQLGQQFKSNNVSIWDIITGDIAAVLGTLLVVIAYIVYAIAIIVFCFFYSLYGAVLYVLGPLILALLPMSGVGQLGRSFATNLMLWNAWGIIYAVLGALITAIQVNQVSQVGGGGFLGFLRGPFDTLILGLVSICYALAIALIPFIAKRLISGDVGATATTMLNAATTAAGIALAGAAGLAGGISAGSGSGATAGSGGGGGGAAGGAGGGSATGAGGASSSTAPPTPSVGQSIRAGIASAVSGESSPSGPTQASEGGGGETSGGGETGGQSHSSPGSATSGSSISGSSRARSGGLNYRPRGVAQTVAHQAGRAIGEKIRGNQREGK
jgi:F420-0:gamma-glutamyl ligase-like protein